MSKIKFLTLIILIISTMRFGICQDKSREVILISSFVNDVFLSKTTSTDIAKKYLIFPPVENSKYSDVDRLKIFERHLKKIRREKSISLNPADYYIMPYQEYEGDKVKFQPDSTGKIFILISKKAIALYFLLMDDRIRAFDYINKGGEGLFITY